MLLYRRKTKMEAKRIILQVIIPRLEASWWDGHFNGGRYCPITALPLSLNPSVYNCVWALFRKAAKKNGYRGIQYLNDNAYDKYEVINALREVCK